MPIIAEASVSWATARIALPCFVEVTNQESSASTGSVISDDRELVPGVADPGDLEGLRAGDEVRHRVVVDAVDRQRDVLDDERHPDSGDQGGEARRRPQPPVGDELDRRVHEREHDHHRDEGEQHPADDPGHARVRIEAEHRHDHRARHEPGEREDIAVREVDQLQDPVDERVAERDEAVDEAVRQPDQPDLDELLGSFDEVPDQPDPDQGEQRGTEERRDARLTEPVERVASVPQP